MNDDRTRVLIVDDSALVRQILEAVLSRDPAIHVVGTSRDGNAALASLKKLQPDVVTLDMEMPGMNGLEVLERLQSRRIAVVVVASRTAADVGNAALARGAFAFVGKPVAIADDLATMAAELLSKVKAAARTRTAGRAASSRTPLPKGNVAPPAGAVAGAAAFARTKPWAGDLLIAIGSSTGGPEAVAAVLSTMPADAPPIVIVQHMPEHFTAKFAQRLDSILAVRVKEAADGDLIKPGQVLIAPGTTHHMIVRREAQGLVVRLHTAAPLMHHRPSVDLLFKSCAETVGRRAVGVILTGMGEDGARGLLAMRQAGAMTIAQNEKTSLVFGMPMEAIALGAACDVLPLGEIGPAMLRLAQPHRNTAA